MHAAFICLIKFLIIINQTFQKILNERETKNIQLLQVLK